MDAIFLEEAVINVIIFCFRQLCCMWLLFDYTLDYCIFKISCTGSWILTAATLCDISYQSSSVGTDMLTRIECRNMVE